MGLIGMSSTIPFLVDMEEAHVQLFQRFLKSGYTSGRQDSRRCGSLCSGSKRGEVSLTLPLLQSR